MNKNTKQLVPKLRFPEFQDDADWTTKPLGNLAKLITEKAGNTSQTLLSVTAGVGLVTQLEKFGREIAGDSYKKYVVIEKGDFAYNKSSTKQHPEGQVALLEKIERGAVPNSIFTCFRVDKGIINPYFLKYPFANNTHGKWLRNFIAVGARANGALQVDSKDLLSLPVDFPSLNEQQKIADCLSSIDDLITAQSQKVEALKAHKKGLMQQLFPREGELIPRLRFPEFRNMGEWNLLPIGEKIELLSGYPFKSSEISEDSTGIPLMRGINVTEGFVRHTNAIDRYFLGETAKLEKYKLRKNDLVIGMDGSKVGKNSALITDSDTGSLLIQRVARLRAKKVETIKFIFQHIHSSKFHEYVDRINTSGGIPHISAEQINQFKIGFPCEEEQQKIADFLSNIDDFITTQTQKLEILKNHKQGLMQQLFPCKEADIE